MRLDGARAWVTGGGSGIGSAVAAALARAGARVAISARNAEQLHRAADPQGTYRFPILVVPVDVTDHEAVIAAARKVEEELGGVDLVLLNAGRYRVVNGAELDAEEFVKTFQVNVFGVLYAAEAVLPGMLLRGFGRIAATSSLSNLLPLPNAAAYGSSKAALTYALESLRLDIEPRGVGVTIIHPGFVQTPMVGRNHFPMPGLMGPEKAATIIVRGLAQDRARIDFPARLAWPLQLASRLPPGVVRRMMQVGRQRLTRH